MDIKCISPIDGRYHKRLERLSAYFSEYALIKKRILVELLYLKALGKGDFTLIHENFDIKEAEIVKEIEKRTNHDIKAVEYYLREKVPDNVREFVHFGLTSEDINNLSYSLLIKNFLEDVFFDRMDDLLETLSDLSKKNKDLPMLAHTHGQPASPTTVGKEFYVFYSRLKKQLDILNKIKLTGKLNGATGNYNALHFVQPERDWIAFTKDFITSLGLEPNLITTQVESRDTLVELFQNIKRINNIILDLDRDLWLYISFDYFKVAKVKDEVGSSTMPHKINPIDFENSEGNIKIANALLTAFEDLQISRLQRDLSDSTMMRNIGVAFGHTMLAIDSAKKGLSKIEPNKAILEKDLDSHPEILAEAIQVFLKSRGIKEGYELLKDFSRGEKMTLMELHKFIDSLKISQNDKRLLKGLKPKNYIGPAADIARID